MKLYDKLKVKRTIRATAAKFGISEEQCRKEMQDMIDTAWETGQQDPSTNAAWKQYFPAGEKPSLEEFISVLGNMIKET